MSYALVIRNLSGINEVYCVDCRAYIGTMDGDTLLWAMMHNRGKGGVKCPNCRKHTCKKCNGRVADDFQLSDEGLCFFCFNGVEVPNKDKLMRTFGDGTLV